MSKKYGKKVIIFAGILGDGYDKNISAFSDKIVCISKSEDSIDENIKNGYKNLMESVEKEILNYKSL